MREPLPLLRRLLPLLSVAVLAAVVYDGCIFYSRWASARDADEARRAEETRRARQAIDLLGDTSFRIINFYAVPETLQRGRHALICYGAYHAKRVRIEPPVEDLHPAISYCFEVAPRKDTTYKLTAEDGAGHTATASLVITVR